MRVTLSLPTAQEGAIDALFWKATPDFTGLWGLEPQQIVIDGWEGNMVFYPTELSGAAGLSVPAALVGSNDHVRYSVGGPPLTFATHLSGDAFERIERFRNAGPLVVRLEGRLKILCLGPERSHDDAKLRALLLAWTPGRSNSFMDVYCEPREIREHWIEHVLPAFGKPHRVVIEVALPRLAAINEAGVHTLAHLREGELEIVHGRYKAAAHATFRALEALQELLASVEAARGKLVRSQISKEISALHGIAHKGRHDVSHDGTPPIEFDRSLAMHLLNATKLIAGFVLECAQTAS